MKNVHVCVSKVSQGNRAGVFFRMSMGKTASVCVCVCVFRVSWGSGHVCVFQCEVGEWGMCVVLG